MNSNKRESNHHRRSIRVPGFDYSQPGAYFTTICTHNRECLFGEIIDGEMRLNEYGLIVREEWNRSALIRAEIELGEFVIMPNHIHGIVNIHDHVGAYGHTPLQNNTTTFRSPSKTIGAIVRGFKSAVTKRINILCATSGNPVWQRNYWEHIIRDDYSYQQIADFFINPQNWENDQFFTGGYPRSFLYW